MNRIVKEIEKRRLKKVREKFACLTDEKRCISVAEGYMDECVIDYDRLKNKEQVIVYSAGIGDQINFELALLKKFQEDGINAKLYAIDPTPKSLEFLKSQKLPDNFYVLPYALTDRDCELTFALPQSDGWVSGSAEDVKDDSRKFDFENKIKVQGRSLNSLMKELGHDRIDLLKMDIEGSEFAVLKNVFEQNILIDQMCVDEHAHMLNNGIAELKKLHSKVANSCWRIINFRMGQGFTCEIGEK